MKKKAPHFGSFYLRIGAIAFGIGTMVYSGLELGQYFELSSGDDNGCNNVRKKIWFEKDPRRSFNLISDFHALHPTGQDELVDCTNAVHL